MPDIKTFVEKRVHPRIPLRVPVKHRVIEGQNEIKTIFERKNNEKTGHTLNMSLGGLCLKADQSLNVGSMLRLEIILPEISRLIAAFGEVVWSNGTGGGLHFAAMREEDVDSLKRYLSQMSPGK